MSISRAEFLFLIYVESTGKVKSKLRDLGEANSRCQEEAEEPDGYQVHPPLFIVESDLHFTRKFA